MKQPDGYIDPEKPHLVCLLQRSLYGLKQAARAWNIKFNDALISIGFVRSEADYCLYIKGVGGGESVYIVMHVDDVLCVGPNEKVKETFDLLSGIFEMKDLGPVSHYLGVEIEKHEGSFLLHQAKKVEKLVKEFGLQDSKPVKTPMDAGFYRSNHESPSLPDNKRYRQAIGSLMYLSTTTRPDIFSAVGILARRVEKPSQADWNAVKRIIAYLNCTQHVKFRLGREEDMTLKCYVDADWAGDVADRKSISGYLFKIGSSCVAWFCRKQTSVALSSTEAEFVAASMATQEAVWMRQLLQDLGFPQDGPTSLMEDNQSCIKFIENERASSRIKHLDVKRCFVHDMVKKKEVKLKYCPSEENDADLLTKPLTPVRFKIIKSRIGLTGVNVERGC